MNFSRVSGRFGVKFLSYVIFFISLLPFFMAKAVVFTQSEVEQYAPIITLHPAEPYASSSVEFFFNYVRLENGENGHYTTIENLPEASSVLSFFHGQSVTIGAVPIYALVVPKPKIGNNVTDILYFTFYPYNRGKNVCVGLYSKWSGCIGGYSTFGNHVGDWEHMLVRFYDKTPTMIYLSTHSGGRKFDWNSADIKKIGNHPYIYSAWGSHGLYERVGRFEYYKLPTGDTLHDDTGESDLKWETARNVVVIQYKAKGTYQSPLEWMNFKGRWGNTKRLCTVERVSGECVLNDGPVGPAEKTVADPNAGPDDL